MKTFIKLKRRQIKQENETLQNDQEHPMRIKKVPNKRSHPTTLLALLCLSFTCTTNTYSQAHETGRFTILETKDGIIRLDKQTGTMFTCTNTASGWSCQPMNNQGLSSEPDNETLSRLKKENLELKQRLEKLEQGQDYKPSKSREKLKLPTDEEVDQAIEYIEKMIRKFKGSMDRLKENPPPPDQEL